MIEIIETCHRRARAAAVERNSGRAVYFSCAFAHHDGRIRFTYRTSATGGAN
jgi:hypothetical protein